MLNLELVIWAIIVVILVARIWFLHRTINLMEETVLLQEEKIESLKADLVIMSTLASFQEEISDAKDQ